MNTKRLSPAVITIIVIVLVGIVASAAITINSQPGSNSETSTQNDRTTEFTSYRDGTYEAQGTYVSPGGLQTINLSVTIENGTIVATSIAGVGSKDESLEYIQRFAGGYEAEVVGKAVNDVSLSRVAGSSLTSIGFNDALDQIKKDAKS